MRFLILLLLSLPAYAENISDYWIQLQPTRHGGIMVYSDKVAHPGPYSGYGQITEWIAFGNGPMQWTEDGGQTGSIEHWGLRAGGASVISYSTGPNNYPTNCLPVSYMEDVATGITVPIDCTTPGQFYAPFMLPVGSFRMHVWGSISTTEFYWQATFTQTTALNTCWYLGPTTLPVVMMTEVYWDSAGGWIRGTGKLPPYLNGQPQEPQATEKYQITMAKGVGPGWTWMDNTTGESGCLYAEWSW